MYSAAFTSSGRGFSPDAPGTSHKAVIKANPIRALEKRNFFFSVNLCASLWFSV
jgi:hypothetical protein